MNKSEKILVLLEPTTIEAVQRGNRSITYSHDYNGLQFAQAALNLGHEVFIASYENQKDYQRISKAWPEVEVSEMAQSAKAIHDFSVVISPNYLAFGDGNFLKSIRGHATTKVLIQAAVHPIEQPDRFYPVGTALYINVIRNNVNFIVTQTGRMKDSLVQILGLIAGFRDPDRILTSKLVPDAQNSVKQEWNKASARTYLGIPQDALVILNAGGVWKWTQFNYLLIAFERYMSNHESNLYILQPALGQSNNVEHQNYHIETQKILNDMPKNIRERVFIGKNWNLGPNGLSPYLAAADYGLNLNTPTLENWQSYRVRMVEYLAFDLPCIVSQGSFWDDEEIENGILTVGHNIDDLYEVLQTVSQQKSNSEKYIQRVRAIKNYRRGLTLEFQAQRTLETILSNPARYELMDKNEASIWDFKYAGRVEKRNWKRELKGLYLHALNVPWLHKMLVSFGFRLIFRRIRKLSTKSAR